MVDLDFSSLPRPNPSLQRLRAGLGRPALRGDGQEIGRPEGSAQWLGQSGHEVIIRTPFFSRHHGQSNVVAEPEALFLLTGPGNTSSRMREGFMSPAPFPEELLAINGDWGEGWHFL